VLSSDPRELAAIFCGGALGALARAGLMQALPHRPGAWPWATLMANLAGVALLGYAVTRLQERLPVSVYRRPFIGTGLCGALTTFSALQLELVQLADAGHPVLGIIYATVSLGAGLLLVAATSALGRRGWAPRGS